MTSPTLEAVNAQDTDWVAWLAHRPHTSYRWRARGLTLSPDDITARLWNETPVQHMVRSGARPLGLIQIYDCDFRNGVAYLSVMAPLNGETSIAELAPTVEEFLDHVRRQLPMRQVYVWVLADLVSAHEQLLPPRTYRAGTLQQHERDGRGSYADLHLLCVPLADEPP